MWKSDKSSGNREKEVENNEESDKEEDGNEIGDDDRMSEWVVDVNGKWL